MGADVEHVLFWDLTWFLRGRETREAFTPYGLGSTGNKVSKASQ